MPRRDRAATQPADRSTDEPMTTKILIFAAALAGLMNLPGTAAASSSDYPPAGAVVVVSGELMVGEVVDVTVHNCVVGEDVYTSLESTMGARSVCESGVSSFSEAAGAPHRLPGVSRYELRLPQEPGVVAGTVELVESGETLSFFLDVRARDAQPVLETVTVASPSSSAAPGWPFLLIAAMIILLVIVAATRDRREHETP